MADSDTESGRGSASPSLSGNDSDVSDSEVERKQMKWTDVPKVGRIRMPQMEKQSVTQADESGKVIEEQPYRFGEVYFEETGKTVPYIIVPRSKQDGRANMNELMINIIKWFDDIPQPQLVIDVSGTSSFGSYYEWAYEAWGNDKGAAQGFNWGHRDDELTCASRLLCVC